MNSVIEAQQTEREETLKELERCKDIEYYYTNYIKPQKELTNKDRLFFEQVSKMLRDPNIIGIVDLQPKGRYL